MNSVTAFEFHGRPDGLGNRVEEIIRLEAICRINDCKCRYVWNNKYDHRTYPILLKSDRVIISEESDASLVKYEFRSSDFRIEKHHLANAALAISSLFDVSFGVRKSPIGIHVRATDRIGGDHPHFMRSENELRLYLLSTVRRMNDMKPESAFICGEDPKWIEELVSKLDFNITILSPTNDRDIPSEYMDFFCLSQCREIWMVSRFSSFSITAAMVGGTKVHCYYKDLAIAGRYPASFVYHDPQDSPHF